VNSFLKNVRVTVFGESHGQAVGAVLDGLGAGVKIDFELIKKRLEFRRGEIDISTPRREADEYNILSGVKNGYTTGAPIAVVIENKNVKSADYAEVQTLARPSHADYTAHVKYFGFNDQAGGGHFSGRVSAPLVVLGAICESALISKGIKIGSHVKRIGDVCDREFENIDRDVEKLNSLTFAVLDDEKLDKMREVILNAKSNGDSVGGEVQTVVTGVPTGVGEPWFDSVESVISHAIFSIGGVKGIEFGSGFEFCKMVGSIANDEFYFDSTVKTKTNHNGGINGGITNGMPIVFNTAIKPTPSIFKEQNTVDYKNLSNQTLNLKGRHDPCIAPRIRAVIDSMTAITLCDLLVRRFGEGYFCSTL
jgi:chorismate synthase